MPDQNSPTQPDTSTPGPTSPEAAPVRPPRRPVYEPSLLPERRRRRVSPWIIIPGLLLLLSLALYFLLAPPRHRRFVATAGQIVYASDAGTPGHPHLWIAAADGSGAHRLTSAAADESSPAWSPDGTQIAFLSTRNGGVPQVFLIDADGQGLTQVTQSGGAKAQPLFAPSDPTLIGFTTGGALHAATVGPTGTQTRRLLPSLNEDSHQTDADAEASDQPVTIPSYAWAPAKDPAAQGLAAVEDRGDAQTLALLPTLGGRVRDSQGQPPNVTPLAAADTLSLAWSPDGGLLAVATLGLKWPAAGRAASGLLLFDTQGNPLPLAQQPLPLIGSADDGPQRPVFSPDGTQIVFEVWRGPDLARRHSMGLFLIPTGGGAGPKALVRGDATQARFTADGQTILFLLRRPDGGHDLYRVNADGTGRTRLSDGKADVSSVAISPQSAQPK